MSYRRYTRVPHSELGHQGFESRVVRYMVDLAGTHHDDGQ